jgi:hypothetical protein
MGYEIKIDPATNAATFEETWSLLDENGEPIDLTGSTIIFNVQDPMGDVSVLRATSEDGSIVITPEDFTVRFEVENMRGLTPKNYFVGLTVELFGDTTQLFEGTLQVLNGRMT